MKERNNLTIISPQAAVHQLVFSLGDGKSGLSKDSLAVAILPNTLDTPMNRKWMSKADTSTWTPLGKRRFTLTHK